MLAVHTLFGLTAISYAIASCLYVAYLARGHEQASAWAARVLAAAVTCHVGFLIANVVRVEAMPAVDIHQALAVMSLVLVLVFLVLGRNRARLKVLGAFITPVTLLLFLGAAFRHGEVSVPAGVQTAVIPLHVAVNVLGLAAFAFAFAAGLAYVIQERQLRKKRLGGLFQRLPALDVLDSLGLRSVMVGFPLLTVGVITGTVWLVDRSGHEMGLSASQVLGILSWILFALVLLLRVAAGWRGRKAAIGTMLGFLCTMAVLLGYVLRDTGGLG